LTSVVQTDDSDTDKEFGFKVEEREWRALFAAKTSDEKESWIYVLRGTIYLHSLRRQSSA
jgi:hypothetical protein